MRTVLQFADTQFVYLNKELARGIIIVMNKRFDILI